MSFFISTKQHVEVCTRLEKEIESLRRENKSLLAYIEEQDLKNAQAVVDELDEWKRRCQSVLRIWKDHYPLTELWKRHGDAAKWFEEE